ncbi:MAG: 3-phosphoserine/phosphohydroxythreonine transaminase [Magnetococcales bacterium]|nr:3-phosphoserine/phosphohydroxythreonine transaminase [Magnetococcales bacterium]MBF0437724.1 3-phosphoserine/phosphohydroxythreonine transaminase [Magnetococcales bacterium]
MKRVYNFSAGPAVLPVSVLERARDEMLDYRGSGMSVMEMSHRSKEYMAIIAQSEALLRQLMGIGDDYAVLFLQGGASLQFTMIPMNLITDPATQSADYVMTGSWSEKAFAEAKKIFSDVRVAATTKSVNYCRIPTQAELTLNPNAAYVHITSNNTIFGTEYQEIPDTGSVPLIADASSNILSRSVDVSRYGMIYAGAQKNLGPSGVTVVIVRKDLLGRKANLPAMLDYQVQAKDGSMYNTPPTYAIYILGLVLEWVKEQGGVAVIEQRNVAKANKLYDAIDASGFYLCPTEKASRSRMNVPFTIAKAELTDPFLAGAKAAGLVTLKGHRSVGGMRASIYNAMPEEGVDALIAFMREFERVNG